MPPPFGKHESLFARFVNPKSQQTLVRVQENRNQGTRSKLLFGRNFVASRRPAAWNAKPVPTFAENALIASAGDLWLGH